MSFITKNEGQFPYFDVQLSRPLWRGKKVLDFGGNVGNILRHPTSMIEPEKYWCIDVSREAIMVGQEASPKAHFLFYDRYNPEYNPRGIRSLPLPISDAPFDFILALSVFTHTSQNEMIEFVGQLRRLLSCDGRLAFTFFDPYYAPSDSNVGNLEYYCGQRLNPLNGFHNHPEKVLEMKLKRCTLACGDLTINDDAPTTPQEQSENGYLVFYTREYLKTIFPDGQIRDPVPPFARQHCCVLNHA